MNFPALSKMIASSLSDIPKCWDGKQAILELKDAEYNWRQTEWIGWYFQLLCNNNLSSIMQIPGPRYGNTTFDGLLEVPWEFKAHAMSSGRYDVIVNDSRAVSSAISDYGAMGLILAMGQAEYNDEQRTFKRWHDNLKGKPSDYVKDRIARGAPSRRRKVSFDLQQISFIRITDDTLVKTGTFQAGFRNADGSPRNPKVKIDLRRIDDTELVHVLEF